MTDTLRVGIIGAGGMGQNQHMPGYESCGDRVEIVAVTDIVEQKAKQAAERFDVPHTFTRYEKMLTRVEMDAVSICTPNKFHAPATVAALEAGCHVLCEKPPALNAQEAQAMARKADESGKILTYGFHFRYSPEVEVLKKYIDAGELGEVYAVNARWMRRRGIPGGAFIDKDLQGGGPMIDLGVHVLDMALFLLDYPQPEVVLGSTYQEIGNRKGIGGWDWEHFTVEDLARGMIRFQNGLSVIVETSFATNIAKRDFVEITLMGDRGGADLFPLGIYCEKHGTLVDMTPTGLPKRSNHQHEVQQFVKCCLEGRQPVSTPEQGVIIQSLIDGFYLSAEEGQAVVFEQDDTMEGGSRIRVS